MKLLKYLLALLIAVLAISATIMGQEADTLSMTVFPKPKNAQDSIKYLEYQLKTTQWALGIMEQSYFELQDRSSPMYPIDLIVAYADECYADSTFQPPKLYFYGETFVEHREKWVHRTPTFEGFIEYLRKRMK